MKRWPLQGATMFSLLACGCQVVAGFDDFQLGVTQADAGENGGSSGSNGNDNSGNGGASMVVCPDMEQPDVSGGPAMIQIQSHPDCFWMDETEVTRAQYQEFLDTDPVAEDSAPCRENVAFEDPECEGRGDSGTGAGNVTLEPDHPMVCVDWCDAQAFCEWAGKTLCNREGSYTAKDVASKNDWYAACSNGGSTVYPYGRQYDGLVCNGEDSRSEIGTVAVDANTSCENDDGVRDLSGNVEEWTNSCAQTSGLEDPCQVRGGSFRSSTSQLGCKGSVDEARRITRDNLGFRCCVYEP